MIYAELRRMAGRYLSRERRNHTLQPTALVHEAWLKLQHDRNVQPHGRTHGLALAAQRPPKPSQCRSKTCSPELSGEKH